MFVMCSAHDPGLEYGLKGNEMRLSGGKNLTNWELVTDLTVLEKLSPEVRDKIYHTDLHASGIKDFRAPDGKGLELFFNERPTWISLYPNKGFLKTAGLVNENQFRSIIKKQRKKTL